MAGTVPTEILVLAAGPDYADFLVLYIAQITNKNWLLRVTITIGR